MMRIDNGVMIPRTLWRKLGRSKLDLFGAFR